MNASERLQRIIQERREWTAFGWGPLLTAWAVALVAKSLTELWTGPRSEIGFGFYFAALVAQGLLALLPGARPGARQVAMHGFWVLVAVTGWFLGSWVPSTGLLSRTGAGVLELMFLAGGLGFTGILKAKRALWLGAAGLVAGALAIGVFPVVWAWRPLLLAATFGAGSVVSWVADRRTPSAV